MANPAKSKSAVNENARRTAIWPLSYFLSRLKLICLATLIFLSVIRYVIELRRQHQTCQYFSYRRDRLIRTVNLRHIDSLPYWRYCVGRKRCGAVYDCSYLTACRKPSLGSLSM